MIKEKIYRIYAPKWAQALLYNGILRIENNAHHAMIFLAPAKKDREDIKDIKIPKLNKEKLRQADGMFYCGATLDEKTTENN